MFITLDCESLMRHRHYFFFDNNNTVITVQQKQSKIFEIQFLNRLLTHEYENIRLFK